MKIKPTLKKLKQKYRPIKWVKKNLRTKRSQRRLLFGVGVVIILVLMSLLTSALSQQGQMQKLILDNQATIEKTSKEIKVLKDDVNEKQKTLEKNAKIIDEKTKKQAELEKKVDELTKQVSSLKAAYGGYGGGQSSGSTQYTAGNSYTPGNCTWGVKNWKPNVPNFWGNANTWDDNARAGGFAVNSSPSVGAVAQTDAGWAGHVALVVAVDGSQVTIKEMNNGGLYNITTRTVSVSEFVYIHI